MATAKKTSYAAPATQGLRDVEAALIELRKDGAPDNADVWIIGAPGFGGAIKAEWHEEAPDPAEPAADEREQPTTQAAA